MILTKVVLGNYKTFHQDVEVEFSPSVTYVLGPNNSGKTTLLEAIRSGDKTDAPHRSPNTIPKPGDSPRKPHSRIEFTYRLTGPQLRDILLRRPVDFTVLLPGAVTQSPRAIDVLLKADELTFRVRRENGRLFTEWSSWSKTTTTAESGYNYASHKSNPETGEMDYRGAKSAAPTDKNELGLRLHRLLLDGAFRFQAERSRALSGVVAPGEELAPDADNLVQVLDNLQARHARFETYRTYVRRVLPEIASLGVFTADANKKEIRIWFHNGERDDLATPIEQAGSGVPNILALLYTITMSDRPRLILIDEPSAFLHPGATRELVRIIKEFPQHQYVVSSHQPIALDELDDVSLVLLKRTDAGTVAARSIDRGKTADQRAVLEAVGASLADVFSAEQVIWVEGPTESHVLRAIAGEVGLPRGVAVLPLVHTGDLEGDDAPVAVEIYRRLTDSGALLPRAIAIVFDDEGRTEKQKAELRARLKGTSIEFLPVRMIENVFLEPELIFQLLTSESSGWKPPLKRFTAPDIAARWDSLVGERYGYATARSSDEATWRQKVHGARVLHDTFDHFTEQRLRYDKVIHGTRLARLAQERFKETLEPLRELVRRLLPPKSGG